MASMRPMQHNTGQHTASSRDGEPLRSVLGVGAMAEYCTVTSEAPLSALVPLSYVCTPERVGCGDR